MKSKLYSGDIVSKAHSIRRAAAERKSLPQSAISWKTCLKQSARGTKVIQDAWGDNIESIYHNINRYLWSGECAVNVDIHSISLATGIPLHKVSKQITWLLSVNLLTLSATGWLTVTNSSRPFPHPTLEDVKYKLV